MTAFKCFNFVDNEIQSWKKFNLYNVEYDFNHVNACKHEFIHPDRNERYILYFTFSHHVFTRSIQKGELINADLVYPFETDKRVFDLVRYNLSKNLPQIVTSMPDQFCYHGGYSRYCSCKIEQKDGTSIYYQVVYRVWKSRGKLRFHVESAYPLKTKLGKVKKVNFWVICHNLIRGKKLPKPAN